MNRFPHTLQMINRKTVAILLALALVAGAGQSHAASAINALRPLAVAQEAIVYQRTANPYIGITVEHAEGQPYAIADKNGKIILKGRISSNKTFFIATAKLAYGSYQFRVGGVLMQQFIIQ